MTPHPQHLEEALQHLDHALGKGQIAVGAAKGLIYSLVETLGVLVGDPALPDQLRDAYEGLQEKAHALKDRIDLAHH